MDNELTVKQKKFADLYMKTGNATQSYKNAGYNCKDDNSLAANAARMLRNDKVVDYIQSKQKVVETKSILSIQEIQEYFSGVVKDSGESTQNKLRAGELLVKMQGGFLDRVNVNANVGVSYEDKLKELEDREEF